MLNRLAEGLWVEERQLRFLGVETGTRMTIAETGAGLFVHSPVALGEALRSQVDELGQVAFIVAPTKFHHLYVPEWAAAYPHAKVWGCPGVTQKRSDIRWHRVLTDAPLEEVDNVMDHVHFSARGLEDEVIFFHKPSQTLVCSDFIFNLRAHPSVLTRAVATLMGQRKPGATFLERLMIRDRVAAKEQLLRIVQWDTKRIVLAHGPMLDSASRAIIENAYAWLL